VLNSAGPLGLPRLLNKQALLDRESFWDKSRLGLVCGNIPFSNVPMPTSIYGTIVGTGYEASHLRLRKQRLCSRVHRSSILVPVAYGSIQLSARHQLYEIAGCAIPIWRATYSVTGFARRRAARRYGWDAMQSGRPNGSSGRCVRENLLPDLQKTLGLGKAPVRSKVGLFWQTATMTAWETNITAATTETIVRGATVSPHFNSYMYATHWPSPHRRSRW